VPFWIKPGNKFTAEFLHVFHSFIGKSKDERWNLNFSSFLGKSHIFSVSSIVGFVQLRHPVLEQGENNIGEVQKVGIHPCHSMLFPQPGPSND
jgi:hypothetical protein